MCIPMCDEQLPLISVIIPVYNTSEYCLRCFNSVLNQFYKKLEIIIIDDGSTDNSPAICDSIAKKDARIKVYHIPNGGVAKARNYGLDNACGKYITFVDSDDYVSPYLIQYLYEAIVDNNASISTCRGIAFYEDNVNPITTTYSAIRLINPKDYNYFEEYAHDVVWGALFEKNTINNIRFDSTIKVGEDTLFFAQAVLKSKCIVDIDNTLYYYYIRSDSLRHKPFDFDRFTDVLARDQIISLFSSNSKESLLSCYGLRTLVAIRCFRENNHYGCGEQLINDALLNFIRKDLFKTMKSGMTFATKLSVIVVCVAPDLYLKLHRLFRE